MTEDDELIEAINEAAPSRFTNIQPLTAHEQAPLDLAEGERLLAEAHILPSHCPSCSYDIRGHAIEYVIAHFLAHLVPAHQYPDNWQFRRQQ